MLCLSPLAGRGKNGGTHRTSSPFYFSHQGMKTMHFGITHLQPIVALIAGILILVLPRLLNYIVAVYLILVGLFGLGVLH